MAPHTWVLILAGGTGRRLAEVTGGVPKQFWRAGGERTLLERTLDRMAPLSSPSRTVVVVDQAHEPYVRSLGPKAGHVLYQPRDRGTAAGVLLALLPILDADPEAVVVMSPADHGVTDFREFRSGLLTVSRLVRRRRSGIVLFGAEPRGFDGSYGWIRPGRTCGPDWLRRVDAFVEKPGPERAVELMDGRAVWNTMVLVAHGRSLFQFFVERQPALTRALTDAWRCPELLRDEALAETYARLSGLDFSHDVLTGAESLAVYTWPASMGWCDLGTPDRLHAWLEAPARPGRAATSAA